MPETGSNIHPRQKNDGISIQVGLSGYSFVVSSDGVRKSSGWTGIDRIFTAPEFQHSYHSLDISVFTPKFTLVPSQFHCPQQSRAILSEVVDLEDGDTVDYVAIPSLAATMVFSLSNGGTLHKVLSETVLLTDGSKATPLPEAYYMLKCLDSLTEYNKIVASYVDGYLYLVIAQGKSLLLCNSFEAVDFTTAEYFIFLAMKRLQLNIEASSIYFRTELSPEQEISLYRYFKNVERI